MMMPEASVYENAQLVLSHDYIGFAGQALSMKAIPEPKGVQQASYRHFYGSVFLFYVRHYFRTF